jgi:hypothetical protein
LRGVAGLLPRSAEVGAESQPTGWQLASERFSGSRTTDADLVSSTVARLPGGGGYCLWERRRAVSRFGSRDGRERFLVQMPAGLCPITPRGVGRRDCGRGPAAPRGSLPSQAPSGVSSAAAQIDESQDRLGLQTLERGHHRLATHVDQPKLGRGENSVSVNPPPMRAPRVAKGRTGAAGVRQRQEAVGEPNSPPGVALRSAMRW